MSVDKMDQKVQELRELRRMQEELAAEVEVIQDEIKAHMDANGMDTLLGFDWRITWKIVTSSPPGYHGFPQGDAGAGGAVHQEYHLPPVRAGMRKASCISADQSQMQEAHTNHHKGGR